MLSLLIDAGYKSSNVDELGINYMCMNASEILTKTFQSVCVPEGKNVS